MRAISEATSFATASRIDDGTDSETPGEGELGSEVPEIFPFALARRCLFVVSVVVGDANLRVLYHTGPRGGQSRPGEFGEIYL